MTTTLPPPPPSRSWLCRRRRWNYLSSCCCFGSGMNSRCWQSRSSFSTPKKLLHSITDLLFSFPAKWAAAAATLTKRNEEASATFKVSLIMAAWLCSPQHTREWGLTLGPATSLPLENYKCRMKEGAEKFDQMPDCRFFQRCLHLRIKLD